MTGCGQWTSVAIQIRPTNSLMRVGGVVCERIGLNRRHFVLALILTGHGLGGIKASSDHRQAVSPCCPGRLEQVVVSGALAGGVLLVNTTVFPVDHRCIVLCKRLC